jgi:hypothetical protein
MWWPVFVTYRPTSYISSLSMCARLPLADWQPPERKNAEPVPAWRPLGVAAKVAEDKFGPEFLIRPVVRSTTWSMSIVTTAGAKARPTPSQPPLHIYLASQLRRPKRGRRRRR